MPAPRNSAATDVAGRRRRPLQARSQRSARRILDAALQILIREGLPGLNTNKVATEAALNISTLYAYFPDKLSIVAALVEEFEAKRGDYVVAHAQLLAETDDWRGWYVCVIDRLVQFRADEPGGVALRRAITSSPELKHLDEESTNRVAAATCPGLLAHGTNLTEYHALAMSRTAAVTITAMLDDAFRTSPHDRQQINELKSVITNYLAQYLD